MYLEISNIASAINKNPFESRDKTLLSGWARLDPVYALKYLLDNNIIQYLNENEETYDLEMLDAYQTTLNKIDKTKFTTKDFTQVENDTVEEYKRVRPEFKEEEIETLKNSVREQIKKDNGNIQEIKTIEKKNYQKGNDKMWYYKIGENKIGGFHDASIIDKNLNEEIVIEVKARTNSRNVRKNEYDLYQLLGYILAIGCKKGKIVQNYNNKIFDSDVENSKEYGIIDIEKEQYSKMVEEIKINLKDYFNDLERIKNANSYEEINNILTIDKIVGDINLPIAKISKNGFVEVNNRFNKICQLLSVVLF